MSDAKLDFTDAAFAEAVLAAAPVIVLVLDAEGRVLHYNAFMERLCGRPIAEVRGLDFDAEFRLDDPRGHAGSCHGASQGYVSAIRGRAGEPRLIEWHDHELVADEGQGRRVVAVGIDITERVRHSSELADRFELFAERVDEVFFLLDAGAGRLLYLSPACERMLGLRRELALSDVAHARALIHPEDRVAVQRGLARQAGAPTMSLEFRILKPDLQQPERAPEVRWVQARWSQVYIHEGDARFAGTLSDVTEQRRTNQQLEELGRVLELLELAIEEVIVVIDARYEKLLYLSKSIQRLGFSIDSIPLAIRDVLEWIHPDDREMVAQSMVQPSTTIPYVFRVRFVDGTYRWFETRLRRLGPDTPLPGAYVALGIDVTKRQQSEARLRSHTDELEARVAERTATLEQERRALREAAERLADAQRIAEVGDWEWEASTDTLRWSDQLYRIFGREVGSHVDYGVFMAVIHPDDRERVSQTIAAAVERREPYEFEHRVVHDDGEVRVVHCLGEASHEEGRLRLKGTSQDVTRREADEGRLRASLAEKEALLHEIHHRVKNNLQVVASLLYLESTSAGDEARAVLDECNARVRSMALIHDYLYHSKEISDIDMIDFMRRLGEEVARVFAGSRDIRIVVSGGGLRLDIEQAIPVALLSNELLTNALKYAYPDLGMGHVAEIRIEVGPQSIEIADDGVGLPAEFELARATSLGLRLVHSLARQLDARFCFVPGPGTRGRLEFARSLE